MTPTEDRNASSRRRRFWNCRAAVFLLVLALAFHVAGRHIIREGLQQMYSPPALTGERLSVYTQLVQLAERHPECTDVFLNMRGDVRFGMAPYSVIAPSDLRTMKQHTGLTADECAELSTITRGMRRIGCLHAYIKGPYVVFISERNYVLPTRPGVLYALDGSNPNNADDDFIKNKMPFLLVKEAWYVSKHLVVSPFHRINHEWPLPESLIDRSTKGPGTSRVSPQINN